MIIQLATHHPSGDRFEIRYPDRTNIQKLYHVPPHVELENYRTGETTNVSLSYADMAVRIGWFKVHFEVITI